jgi:lysophospholipase L1-like esterase
MTSRGLPAAVATVAGVLLATVLAGCSSGQADATASSRTTRLPSSMDALGASGTRGYDTGCPDAWTDCPESSWATGTNPVVDSVYLRLLGRNPQIEGSNANDAESGTAMADLPGQARGAVRRRVELVTIAMGTNDACGGRRGVMTDVAAFRASFVSAMDILSKGLPGATVLVMSIPDSLQVWQAFHTDPAAIRAWRRALFCPALLTNPTSTAPSDVERRVAFRERVVAYNAVVADVCAAHSRCRTDSGALFAAPLEAADVSTNDYWHPTLAGQAKTARIAWTALGY